MRGNLIVRTTEDLSAVEPDRIRTFSIIDHGKSTLADRMLEDVGALRPGPRPGPAPGGAGARHNGHLQSKIQAAGSPPPRPQISNFKQAPANTIFHANTFPVPSSEAVAARFGYWEVASMEMEWI